MLSVAKIAFSLAAATFGMASADTYMATTYSPMHSYAYPLNSDDTYNQTALLESMDADMALISKHFAYARTYYSQYYGNGIAEYAAKNGVKLYLGVYMTTEDWQATEISNAIAAVQNYPDAIEAILVGNENLYQGFSSDSILSIVSEIKEGLGDAASSVKFGTVQRITEYLDSSYDTQTAALAAGLDILGVNIYPFFSDSYDSSDPTALLQEQWDEMAAKFSVDQMLLTETGYATAGAAPTEATSVTPSLENSVTYFEAVANWAPTDAETSLKFWFDFFDRRPDDTTMSEECELHFGIYDYARELKSCEYLEALGETSCSSTTGSSTTTASTDSTTLTTTSTDATTSTTTTDSPTVTTATPSSTTATPSSTTAATTTTTTTATTTASTTASASTESSTESSTAADADATATATSTTSSASTSSFTEEATATASYC